MKGRKRSPGKTMASRPSVTENRPRGRRESLIERCRTLHDDVGLDTVRRWKEQNPGGRALGYLPIYIPAEILHACGALPVGIIGGGDRIDVIRGDAYFQSYICRIPRSTVELGLTGRLDVLDGMLFPAICDVIRNLSGVWQILFPDRLVRFVDFPQNFSPGVGGRFYRQQLLELAGEVGQLTGIDLEPDRLRRSLELYDENRRRIRALHEMRRRMPERAPTYEVYLLQRAGHLLPVEDHNSLLGEYLELASTHPRPARDNARVVLVGSFCEQPPLALVRSLELAGCYVVDDDFLLGNRLLTEEVGRAGDPLDLLVSAYLRHTLPCSSVYDGQGGRFTDLVERVKRYGADGVVFAAPSFCDPALLDRPPFQKELEKAGIPYTAFQYAENTGQLGAIREQVGTFAESIRLWGSEAANR